MITTLKAKVALLALTCAAASGIVFGCSSDPTNGPKPASTAGEDAGGIGLNLELADGVVVNTVHYVVETAAPTPGAPQLVIQGDINVADSAATISVLIGGLAPGNYTITLSADSVNGEVHCGGSAPFTITTGTTTAVSVDLTCSNEDEDGVVVVDGDISSCTLDVIEYYTAAPLQTSTNGTIALTSSAIDVSGQQPDYMWTTTGSSTITNPASPNATFNCNGDGGPHTITLTVSTDTNADIPGQEPVPCFQTVSFDVLCVALTCGNGVIDSAEGETCDTLNDPSCPADCTLPVCQDGDIEGSEICDDGNDVNTDNCPNDCSPASCGDNTVEGSEQCDPPNPGNGNTCSATCQDIPISCGNGLVQPGEECDPPNGTSCDANCQTIFVATCGDGIVTAPGEECELPQQANCGGSCTNVASTSCWECQQSKPNLQPQTSSATHACNFWADDNMPASGPAVGTGKSRRDLCWELLECMFDTECAEFGATHCFCGSDAVNGCGEPNGECIPQMQAAFESTAAGTIGGRFNNTTFGGQGAVLIADRTSNHADCNATCFSDPAKPIVLP